MTLIKKSILVVLGSVVTACDLPEIVTRDAPISNAPIAAERIVQLRSYNVADVVLKASSNLSVSEANTYYPSADIVWRGDPYGDRRVQVMSMFDTAIQRNQSRLWGARDVQVEVDLVRFHGVTERTRFSIGGVYNAIFDLTVRDYATGEIIEGPRRIEGNLPAPGGGAAYMQEQRGETEKVRVTQFLTQILYRELTGEIDI